MLTIEIAHLMTRWFAVVIDIASYVYWNKAASSKTHHVAALSLLGATHPLQIKQLLTYKTLTP